MHQDNPPHGQMQAEFKFIDKMSYCKHSLAFMMCCTLATNDQNS